MRILAITLSTLRIPGTALFGEQATIDAVKAAETAYPDLAIKDSAFH